MASHSLTLEQEDLDRVNLSLPNIQPFNKGNFFNLLLLTCYSKSYPQSSGRNIGEDVFRIVTEY